MTAFIKCSKMFQFKNIKCEKLYASGNRVRLVSMATCSLLFTRSHALFRFNSLVCVCVCMFSLLICLVASLIFITGSMYKKSSYTCCHSQKATYIPSYSSSDIQVTPCWRMSRGVFLTCAQSVTKVTLSIAMTINTPTTCPPLAFVNLWLNQCGTESRQKSHLTYFDKNKLMNKSCSFPHNSSALFRK